MRATLTDAGSAQLTGVLGPRVALVEGTLIDSRPDSLVLRAARTETSDGRENTWSGERIAVPASAVASLRTRQIDRKRSVIAGVLGAAAVVVSIIALRGSSDDGSSRVVVQQPPAGQ